MSATRTYVAVPGDYLVKIASEHGVTWQEIWNHPANAEHRQKRRSPDILNVGDVLQIPTVALPGERPSPPVDPPSIPPLPSNRTQPSWPYGELPSPLSRSEPSWACPAGLCVCHPSDVRPEVITHTLFVHDHDSRRMPGARCRVFSQSQVRAPDYAGGDGSLEVEMPDTVGTLVLEWAPANAPLVAPYPYRRSYHVHLGEGMEQEVARRLNNIGFMTQHTLEERIAGFQATYGLPVDGRAETAHGPLSTFHDAATLPPLFEEPDPEHPGAVRRRPGPPLPPDVRPPSQGCVAAVEVFVPRTCHFSFVLTDDNGTAVASAPYLIRDGLRIVHRSATDGSGVLEMGDVPQGDYQLEIRGITMSIPAIGKQERQWPMILRADR